MWVRAFSIVSVGTGLVLLIPTVYYSYLNVDPPKPRPGDLYFGDGTGFVIAALFAFPAVLALAAGLIAPWLWRQISRQDVIR
jgi:hypothetical protein